MLYQLSYSRVGPKIVPSDLTGNGTGGGVSLLGPIPP